jgi:uncharacterized membrane-anchored protein
MTQDEADKLMRDVESAHGKEPKAAAKAKATPPAPKAEKVVKPVVAKSVAAAPVPAAAPAPVPAKSKAKTPAKPAAKAPAKKSGKKR